MVLTQYAKRPDASALFAMAEIFNAAVMPTKIVIAVEPHNIISLEKNELK